MKVQDFSKVKSHVTFSKSVVRIFVESGSYLVKLFKNEEFINESQLNDLEWFAFPNQNELCDWVVEFWDTSGENLIHKHFHLVHGSNVLFVPSPKESKSQMISRVIHECKESIRLGATPWIFFESAHEYRDLFKKEGINLFKIGGNTRMNFPFIIEKEF